MQIGYKSDIGLQRQHNEDSLICLRLDTQFRYSRVQTGLFAVADGMGGHIAGEVASEFAVKTLATEWCLGVLNASRNHSKGETTIAENTTDILVASFREVNKRLFEKARDAALQGMGTTLTAAVITGPDLCVANVGDSRCYIINSREIIQVSRDHSVVQDLVRADLIRPEEARNHPRKNVLTRAVGYQEDIEPESFQRKLYQGDIVLLCSDGLWGVLSDGEIAKIVLGAKTPEQACIELVARANEKGGPDNISVIVVKPDNLPSWQESLTLETQVIKSSDIPKRKSSAGLFSVFRRKAI